MAGQMFDPELVVYNAGTDILDGDPLGRLKVMLILVIKKLFIFHIIRIIVLPGFPTKNEKRKVN